MRAIATAVTAGLGVAYLYWFFRSYLTGNDGLNDELFD